MKVCHLPRDYIPFQLRIAALDIYVYVLKFQARFSLFEAFEEVIARKISIPSRAFRLSFPLKISRRMAAFQCKLHINIPRAKSFILSYLFIIDETIGLVSPFKNRMINHFELQITRKRVLAVLRAPIYIDCDMLFSFSLSWQNQLHSLSMPDSIENKVLTHLRIPEPCGLS